MKDYGRLTKVIVEVKDHEEKSDRVEIKIDWTSSRVLAFLRVSLFCYFIVTKKNAVRIYI